MKRIISFEKNSTSTDHCLSNFIRESKNNQHLIIFLTIPGKLLFKNNILEVYLFQKFIIIINIYFIEVLISSYY